MLCFFRGSEYGISLGLYGLDLLENQLKPVKLAPDLPLQMFWQRAAIAGPELFQPLPAIAVHRLILDALREE
jgi:hypothetical protein